MKRRIKLLIPWILSLAIVAYVLLGVDLEELKIVQEAMQDLNHSRTQLAHHAQIIDMRDVNRFDNWFVSPILL